MDEYKKDFRLNEIYDEWLTQWQAIEHPQNLPRIEKLREYSKWRKFLEFWVLNVKGLSMSDALSAYRLK